MSSARRHISAPQPVSLPPKRINLRPVKIRIDRMKACRHDLGFRSGDECVVSRTGQAFLVVALQGLADRICDVGRDALDLLPSQPLDHGDREPRRSRRPVVLLLRRAASS